MKIVRGDGRDWSDDEMQRALQSLYASPTSDSYWSALERRIMAAVAVDRPREWWSYFPGWVRLGLSAAAAATIVAGAVAWQTFAAQQRVAAERLLDSPDGIPVLTETYGPESSDKARAATLRYLITHD